MILGLPEEEYFSKGHRACAGCGAAIAMRLITKACGKNTIIAHATGCMEVVSTPYPQTAWLLPWIHVAFENAAAVASGIYRALKILKKDKNVKVIAIAGDGGTYDIGFQALSGAFERKENICFVCYNNEAYMNTGIQRSGATPLYANTTTSPIGKLSKGKIEFKKPLPLIMAVHGGYVASANIAFPQDLYKKVKKGLAFNGPAYIEIFSPCVTGWGIPPNKTITLSKLAFETKVSPLYEVMEGKLKFTLKPNKFKAVKEFLIMQKRFKHLTDKEIKKIQEHVDKEFKKLEELEKKGVEI